MEGNNRATWRTAIDRSPAARYSRAMSDASADPYVSITDAAERPGVVRGTIYHWIARGWCPAVAVAGRQVLRRERVDEEEARKARDDAQALREREHGLDTLDQGD